MDYLEPTNASANTRVLKEGHDDQWSLRQAEVNWKLTTVSS